jgi:3-hydroxyacyl-CoA dehydrogenase
MDQRSVTGHAVVLGAGVMGAQIAAHLVNAGWKATLLDVPGDPANPTAPARRGLERAAKARPAAFFLPDLAERITLGTLDDLGVCAEADWVVEAVVEKPEIKHALHQRLENAAGPYTVLSTNTSGLSLREMLEGRGEAFRRRFLGTHFFNPPRYMKLLEIIPTPETDPDVLKGFVGFAETVLGKRTVMARDTPGFIANRLGVYSMQSALHATLKHGLTVEEVDAITGPLIGRPKSATFRLSDICGLDITADVATNLFGRLPEDRYRPSFALPSVLSALLKDGRLGEKSGAGFYKRLPDKTILALDWETLDYRARRPASFPALEALKGLPLAERLRRATAVDGPAGAFLWETLRDTLCYTADAAEEIAEDIVAIDNAVKWGFGWELGPFEIWDALGVDKVVQRLEAEGTPIPALVGQLLGAQQGTFYLRDRGRVSAVHLPNPATRFEVETAPEYISLSALKETDGTIKTTPDCDLVDLGDGVFCLEFHTKMNTLGPGITGMLHWSLEETRRNGRALVIGNQGEHFSAGFNIQLILASVLEQDWDEMLAMTRHLQETVLMLKRAPVPVVAAVHGYTLGGGCEVMLHCAAVQAAAETFIGLPEVGIGVIPAGGGTTEMLVRAMDTCPPGTDPFAFVHQVFETLGWAKVGTSAAEAHRLGFLRHDDGISMNRDRLLHDAKARALALAESGYRPAPPAMVPVMGAEGIARFELELHVMRQGGWISEHDQVVGRGLAEALCGGHLRPAQTVSEEYLLQVEREVFVRLCSTPKTAERMRHMLETGKPLRN